MPTRRFPRPLHPVRVRAAQARLLTGPSASLTLLWRHFRGRAWQAEPCGRPCWEADANVAGRAGDDEEQGGEQVTARGWHIARGGESRSWTDRRRGGGRSTR